MRERERDTLQERGEIWVVGPLDGCWYKVEV
jgi:hypothetical protein